MDPAGGRELGGICLGGRKRLRLVGLVGSILKPRPWITT